MLKTEDKLLSSSTPLAHVSTASTGAGGPSPADGASVMVDTNPPNRAIRPILRQNVCPSVRRRLQLGSHTDDVVLQHGADVS